MRTLTIMLVGSVIVAGLQPSLDKELQANLRLLFPAATSFSPKEGNPPHFKAYKTEQITNERTHIGFIFWTTELEPLERGYDGPIKILVGMDTAGVLTGIVVVEHNEPYGNFSVDPPEFALQFIQKSIRDGFKVGADIDAVSRATVTVRSSSRAIRNGSRRMARQFLTPDAVK